MTDKYSEIDIVEEIRQGRAVPLDHNPFARQPEDRAAKAKRDAAIYAATGTDPEIASIVAEATKNIPDIDL